MLKLTFTRKLWIPLIASLFGLFARAMLNAYDMRTIRYAERQTEIRAVTDNVFSILKSYKAPADAGEFSQ